MDGFLKTNFFNMDNSRKDEFFQIYKNIFIQRIPRYSVKQIGAKSWKTKNKPLSDIPVMAHLNGQYYVGVLGKWYPGFAILDFDDMPKKEVERKREALGLDERNSMLQNSESLNSSHLLILVSYNHKPPTIRLLHIALGTWAKENGIELYPQANRVIRLPFGYKQDCQDIEYIHLKDWTEKLKWFNKLDEFELKNFPLQQLQFDFYEDINLMPKKSTFSEGKYLFENGLVTPHSRHESQFKVLYYLHMDKNITPEIAIELTWQWIKKKHNGYSKQIITTPRSVYEEIKRQAMSTWAHYERIYYYPNEINNKHYGFITKPDIQDIIMLSKASQPMIKFCSNLIKYCNPRRHRTFINIHSDNLTAWSRRGYLTYLEALQRQGIITRSDSYQADKFSKSIQIKWNWKDSGKAILIDGRAPESFEKTIQLSYGPEEFRELLLKAGSERTTAIMAVEKIF